MSETKHLEEILTLQGRLLGLMKVHGELQRAHMIESFTKSFDEVVNHMKKKSVKAPHQDSLFFSLNDVKNIIKETK